MPLDIGKIFNAEAKSAWGFLVENGQGCYIPAYQRPYSWGKDNVERLFEDAIHGINMLLNRPETVTFLGSIITIHDTKYSTVKPIFKSEVAQRVMTIIDGQQRLSTFLMTNIALHDQIRRLATKYEAEKEEYFEWIYEQSQRFLPELEESFVLDMRTGDENYRYYPRIIRAYDDVWSRKKVQAQYTSPIARLIWDYFDKIRTDDKAFKYSPTDKNGNITPQHKIVSDVFKLLQKNIRQITQNNDTDRDFPNLIKIIQKDEFNREIWGAELPQKVVDFINNQQDHPFYSSFSELFCLILLGKYMNNRMVFTVVTTVSEDDAFDMFEALNTTGEPLTAYETFKPKVIESETLEGYEQSASNRWIKQIEEYLDRFQKAEQKQKSTSEMLVPFALSETGTKLAKRLNDQRRYLRDQYSALTDLEDKRKFVMRVSHIAYFMKNAWNLVPKKSLNFDPLGIKDPDTIIGFYSLKKMNHHIIIAPLSRFYGHALNTTDSDEKIKRTRELEEAIRATAAFSMLWRGFFGGTKNIDSHYREIMKAGIKSENIPPLALRPDTSTGVVSLSNYKKALRYFLREKAKITTKEDWVKTASQIPIYKSSKPIVRFMLFCASDDAIPDSGNPGLIKKGRLGTSSMMAISRWLDEDYFTVEHIAPQTSTPDWNNGIYENPDIIHQLGNFLLLPKEINSIVGNRSWAHKRQIFKLLCAQDQEEYNTAETECERIGLELSITASEILEKANHLGMCKSVSSKNGEWSKEFIEQRSERIAELAWDRIAPWLDLK